MRDTSCHIIWRISQTNVDEVINMWLKITSLELNFKEVFIDRLKNKSMLSHVFHVLFTLALPSFIP